MRDLTGRLLDLPRQILAQRLARLQPGQHARIQAAPGLGQGHAATRAQEQAAAAGSPIAASWRLTADCAPSRRAATLVRLPRSAIWMNKRH